MIVVSDTTPLHYLILLDLEHLLPEILGDIVIPAIVYQELQAEKTPIKIKEFISKPRDWLKIVPTTGTIDRDLMEIDPGEREAILLAEELKADGLLIDDLDGRIVAGNRGIFVIGTLGVLEMAASRGKIDFKKEIGRIRKAGFYLTDELERFFLRRLGLI